MHLVVPSDDILSPDHSPNTRLNDGFSLGGGVGVLVEGYCFHFCKNVILL